jgi:hypothetical protein
VYGYGVTVVRATPATEVTCQPDEPLRMTDLRFDQYVAGMAFDLTGGQTLETGPAAPVTPDTTPAAPYQELTISGSLETSTLHGAVRVAGMDGAESNYRSGGLTVLPGDTALPRTAIVPNLFASQGSRDGNRLTGGQLAAALQPGIRTLWIPRGTAAQATAEGVVTSDGWWMVLESGEATGAGTGRGGFPALLNGRLHLLTAADTLRLPEYTGPPEQERAEAPAFRYVRPNPFFGSAQVGVKLPEGGRVSLELFDTLGRRTVLFDQQRPSGSHILPLAPERVASGWYVLRLNGPGGEDRRKVVYLGRE